MKNKNQLQKHSHLLINTILLRGIHEEDLLEMLPCINGREKHYEKGDVILHAGDHVSEIGVVLNGSVNVVVNFYWGGSNIFGHIEKGDIFAETYAASPDNELLGDVIAAEDCDILFLNMQKLLTTCERSCPHHQKMIQNLLRITASKNLALSTRMMHTAPKTIRDRLLSYLSEQSLKQGSDHFTIPFSRQELADYLGVDRSALSNELSKMQQDGLIRFRKNEFRLIAS